MAETAVSYAIQKLESFLVAEVKLQRGLKREIESMQNELASINTVLKDADNKAQERNDIKEWLKQVRKMAFEIEDVLDEYLALKQAERNKLAAAAENKCKLLVLKIRNQLVKVVNWIPMLKQRHKLVTTIKDIKAEIGEIQRRKESYKLVTATSEDELVHKLESQDYRSYYSRFVEDSELLCIDQPKINIITLLNSESTRFVVAVVGMGGVGKTTLVHKVYEDKEVKKHFQLCAWVSVSQSYKEMEVLRSIFKQFLNAVGEHDAAYDFDGLSDTQIIDKLRDFLHEQHNHRYLVVLDDIWDPDVLHCIKGVLPSDVNGRILITTRDKKIAHVWTTSLSGYVHEVRPLPPDEAWHLFCMKTFGSTVCPWELEDLSCQIVQKCEGLPLAIAAIGGFLSTKQCQYSDWRKLLNSLGPELTSNSQLTSVRRILLLSYHKLPHYLKPCFLYFGMFPEDYSISRMRLIRSWIAEGFVKPQRGKTVEDVGEEYLNELIQRNLVQVAKAHPSGKRIHVRVHDILREIIISELEETGFGQLVSNDNMSMSRRFRRLSINKSNFVENNMLEMIGEKSKIRCLILMGDNAKKEVPRYIINSLVKHVPLLKVLDLQDALIYDIPKEVGNLRLLCFLSLRNTKVKTLPKSIGQLMNLETLDLRSSLVRELPKETSHLCKLRHLRAYRFESNDKGVFIKAVGVKIQTGVLQNLKELQKLTLIEIGGQTMTDAATIIKEVSNLKQLRKLGLSFRSKNRLEICSVIQEMQYLESLYVETANKDEILGLQDIILKNPSLLQRLLMMRGLMHNLPGWVAQLNLVSLVLRHSKLQEDPLPILRCMPNLVELSLREDAYDGDQMDFGVSGFPKLQVLVLERLRALKSIKGSPSYLLNRGYIKNCPMLKYVPSNLQHLVL